LDLATLAKAHIAALKPYEPGKPIDELERELGISEAVKLASNENPLGPSPRAVAAMREAVATVNRYPDGKSYHLRHGLAERLAVDPEQLVFGSGSDEILELLAKTFLGPGDEVVFPWPSFAMYPIVTQGMGATPVAVPLGDGFAHDLDAMRAAVNAKTRLLMVCTPNNPTGTSIGSADFDAFMETLPDAVITVVDEAYFEYVRRPDRADAIAWVARRPATILLRTFSKAYGLAGQRIGYGIASGELIGLLERARHPFNVNLLGEIGALAALDDKEHLERTLTANAEGMDWLRRELGTLGIEVAPSDANFVLARTGADVYQALLRRGVIVRPMAGFGLPEYVRITVGTEPENRRLVEALRAVREAGAA
jgi:histidinol-phosphate aminotransferase